LSADKEAVVAQVVVRIVDANIELESAKFSA
jgi:hypothetical protein